MNHSFRAKSAAVGLGLLLLAANGWVQYLLWFGGQGLVRWRETRERLLVVQEENRVIETRIQRLKEQILLVEKEPLALEEVARRDLGMVYPDETIFIILDQ